MKKRGPKAKNDDKPGKLTKQRKRKSSSSESEDNGDIEIPIEQSEETKIKRNKRPEKTEVDNAQAVSGRITRHSRRLQSSTASDETRELTPDVQSPIKTGKSSPFSSSPAKDSRKKDGTPDKHKAKDLDVWKVNSAANGATSGEIPKLKICRRRSPAPESYESPDDKNDLVSIVDASIDTNDVSNIEMPVSIVSEISKAPSINVSNTSENNSNENNRNNVSSELESEVSPKIENITLPSNRESVNEVAPIKHQPKQHKYEENVDDVLIDTKTKESKNSYDATVKDIKEKIEVEVNIVNEEITQIVAEKKDQDDLNVPVNNEKLCNKVEPSLEEMVNDQETELVLTVEETIDDATIAGNNEKINDKPEQEKTKSWKSSLDMDEVYDYEQDETKEEGELSGNEAVSPVYEVFRKLPDHERRRKWDTCNIICFNRCDINVNENLLKSRNIIKRVLHKDELESSDADDLVFVKEIREENIVHEIESEANTTAGDADDPSPARRKKFTLQSDKIIKNSNKQSRRTVINGEEKCVLYITGLVRPFTLGQLKELLQRTGKIVEDGFWIDSIKSKCYVQFENEDQADETRHALHGIKWPVSNPRVLHVSFASVDDLVAAQAKITDESEIPRKTEPLMVSNNRTDERRLDWKKTVENYDDKERDRPRRLKDVREWDIGKPAHPDEMIYEETEDAQIKRGDESIKIERNRRERDRKRRYESPEEDMRMKKHKRNLSNDVNKSHTEGGKSLDDLFRRTVASPNIYWLPLTDEQIIAKEENKKKKIEELNKNSTIRKSDENREVRDRDRERDRERERERNRERERDRNRRDNRDRESRGRRR